MNSTRVVMSVYLLSLCSCLVGPCEPNWSGNYSASVVRRAEGCTEQITEVPVAEEAIIKDVRDDWYDVYLVDPNSPDCRIEFEITDSNVAAVRDAHDCEGGIVPYGFSIGGGLMSRISGKMKVKLEWWKQDEHECWLYDDWTLE